MTATQGNSNVLHFGKKPPRRPTIAKLAENYVGTLAGLLRDLKINDGTLAGLLRDLKINDGTTGEGGEALVRDPETAEIRHSAVITAAQFCVALLRNRVAIEYSAGTEAPHMLKFHDDACGRVVAESVRRMGPGMTITLPAEHVRALTHMESEIATGIFGAFRLEMQTNPNLQEHEFWRDVFLGLSDSDATGVVGTAARMVFLDHTDEFETAWLADVLSQAPQVTRN